MRTEAAWMIKRVISADNVMETALVRPLLVERESNSWTLKVFTSLPTVLRVVTRP